MNYIASSTDIPLPFEAALFLRIVLATFCGVLVGYERSRRFKGAGVRTHSMVACTAAVLMIISKYGFTDLEAGGAFLVEGVRGADPSRIAAQIVSGVSFLGVGIIYRDSRNTTKGLTTAAGIWAVSGIGMAVGAGLYLIGLASTVFILLLQYFTHRFTIGGDQYSDEALEITFVDDPAVQDLIRKKLEEWGTVNLDTKIRRDKEGLIRAEIKLKTKGVMTADKVAAFALEHPEIRAIHFGE